MFEKLESRQLFSGGGSPVPTPSPIPDYDPVPTIHVNGTDSPDTITLSQSGNILNVIINGVPSSYDLTNFWKVEVDGKGGSDTITADASVTHGLFVYGGPGSDIIHGGSGNDWVYGGYGMSADGAISELSADWVYGGAGNDILNAAWHAGSYVYGEAGNDTIYGHDGWDHLYGGADNDTMKGNDGGDYMEGGTGNDKLYGHAGDDTLLGQAGNDYLDGGLGSDVVFGGYDNDTLLGGGGNQNYLFGEDGDDTFIAEAGPDEHKDSFSGGTGFDTATYAVRKNGVNISLDDLANDGAGNGGENDNICSDVEAVWGGNGDDTLTGSSGNNYLYGQTGNDTLKGMGGADCLYGWYGSDLLIGGAGDDWLYGEQDDDSLVSIGGGTHDHESGGAGNDQFWLDDNGTETHDADSAEIAHKNVHRVASFVGNVSKEANGQDIADPVAKNPDNGKTFSYAKTFTRPLFPSAGPSLDEIKQGGIGSCSYLAALGAVAKTNASWLRNTAVELGDGSYAVRFFSGGNATYVRVDSDLAMSSDGFTPAFAQYGNEGSMWIPILEKALARNEGNSYAGINGMSLAFAFARLGLTPAGIASNGATDLLKKIRGALTAGNAVTAGTIDTVSPTDAYVENHAFTVVSVNANFSKITVRNPWGRDGKKSDTDLFSDGYIEYTASQFASFFDDVAVAVLP